jgi:hypothetical protein
VDGQNYLGLGGRSSGEPRSAGGACVGGRGRVEGASLAREGGSSGGLGAPWPWRFQATATRCGGVLVFDPVRRKKPEAVLLSPQSKTDKISSLRAGPHVQSFCLLAQVVQYKELCNQEDSFLKKKDSNILTTNFIVLSHSSSFKAHNPGYVHKIKPMKAT